MSQPVLVVGAGPTGLTLALDLARRNIPVRIVDKAAEFFASSRGDGIQPRTLEVFDDLGILDAVHAAGMPMPEMRIHLDGTFVTARRMWEPIEPMPTVPYPNPWVLGQSGTEGILRDRLAEFGVQVELGTTLVDFDQDDSGVTAMLARAGAGETVRVTYLIGADGGKSAVRTTLGIPFEGSTDESIRMLLGDVRADALDHEFGYWFAAADRPMEGIALSPLPGGHQFQFAAPFTGETQPSLELLQNYLSHYSGREDITLTDLTWVTVWRPNVRLARRFRDVRVFLAGDAAHAHPPTGGQGMNTGIQDGYNLGWKLAAALSGDDTLLDSYESERRAVAARVLGLSSDLLDKLVDGDEDAMQRGPETQQLDISYRDPAAPETPAVGDRAPDAPLEDDAGRPVRLFDLFRGPHATLLAFGVTAVAAQGVRAHTVVRPGTQVAGPHVVDVDGYAYAAYAATDGAQVLVRPDGYLGAIS
ncbi:FAD-dependent monooxygenase [Nocardia sp. NPDC049220]|uniref:FAD-dependent monooxygenase n=1 Tax=Nocardia sp. NPDC049220 TaxID=3155273 RepID=UPI0033DB64B7